MHSWGGITMRVQILPTLLCKFKQFQSKIPILCLVKVNLKIYMKQKIGKPDHENIDKEQCRRSSNRCQGRLCHNGFKRQYIGTGVKIERSIEKRIIKFRERAEHTREGGVGGRVHCRAALNSQSVLRTLWPIGEKSRQITTTGNK